MRKLHPSQENQLNCKIQATNFYAHVDHSSDLQTSIFDDSALVKPNQLSERGIYTDVHLISVDSAEKM